jgi:hypothetical protein
VKELAHRFPGKEHLSAEHLILAAAELTNREAERKKIQAERERYAQLLGIGEERRKLEGLEEETKRLEKILRLNDELNTLLEERDRVLRGLHGEWCDLSYVSRQLF